jgi:gamma-glutamylcyclotransferase (GGCT)/AIG2-like uncharacterized protein YtfP
MEQKENRTGNVREVKVAWLVGYRIAFDKRGIDGTGKANIVPDAARTVWGVVYRCSPEALDRMDVHEGTADGHYDRTDVQVRYKPGDGTEAVTVEAVTCIAGDSFRDDSLVPNGQYLKTILQGARDHGLPHDYVSEIESVALGYHGTKTAT